MAGNQKRNKRLAYTAKRAYLFLSDKEYDLVNKDEIRFKKN